MSQFTTPLNVQPFDTYRGKTRWQLLDPFEYHVGKYPSDNIIVVPKGFLTDFASIPKLFWYVLPPYSKEYGKAAVIHDYCYATAICSRKESDLIFLEGMEVLGAKRWKRKTMYYAVYTFGWNGWNRHRKQIK